MKRWRILLAIGILSVGLATGLYFANQQRTGVFEVRKKAAEIQGSQLLFKGPQKVMVGEKFSVDLVLDTTTDSQYTISGVDAVVTYQGVTLVGVSPGKIFDSYPVFPVEAPYVFSQADGPSVSMVTVGDVACPQDAKQCPGGMYVGRIGPDCVFAPCPVSSPKPSPTVIPRNPFTISGVKNYAVNDQGYFNGFSGQGVFATLTFVAQSPGNATISFIYKGPSATDDTNINGFLANQPVSLQKPQERLLISPQGFTVEVAASQPTPTPTPTPTPQPIGKLSFTLSDSNRNPVRQTVKILAEPAYQMGVSTNVRGATAYAAGFSELIVSNTPPPQTTSIPPAPPVQRDYDGLVLLGETQTDASGGGQITIKNEYLSKPWALYAQTPSHLIRYMQVNIYPVWFSPDKIVDVKFDKLIPGDIYIAEGQNRQDGVINNFDVADLFRYWGPYEFNTDVSLTKPPIAADFNADGTVNNRDLVILLSSFGKKGDYPMQTSSTGTDTAKGCLASGGVWQRWGLAQREFCQIPAKDAGKPCTDGSQCSYGSCRLTQRNGPINDVSVEGKTISVSFNRPKAVALDWIGLWKRGTPYASYLQWKYLTNTQVGGIVPMGQVTFTNVADGDYDVRFFPNNGSEEIDRANVSLPSPSGSVMASCATYPNEFGCYRRVVNGKAAESALCVD